MNDINKKENNIKKDKKIYLILGILSLLLIAIGATYAYLIFLGRGTFASKPQCYSVTYTKGQAITGSIEKGTNYLSGTSTDIKMYSSPSCATMTGTLYITTNSDSKMDFSDNALRYTVLENNTVVAEGAINGKSNQVIYTGFTLNKTQTTYKVYVWLNSELEDIYNINNETYSGYIHAEAVVNSDSGASLLTLNKLGLTRFLKGGTPNFSSIATTDEGIFAAFDDLGTSYYFRGASENNYVKFGKWSVDEPDIYRGYYSATSNEFRDYSTLSACENSTSYNYNCTLISKAGKDMYWRIIRINGDGTVRMIYDGTSAHENGEISPDRYVAKSQFNTYDNDNTYVGYMYGTPGATTYAETHSNKYDSPIKTYLEDTWYKKNIKDNESGQYEQYIADAIYCNDRSIDKSDATSTGIGTSTTEYAAYDRLMSSPAPVLTCKNQNDRFTYNASVGGVLGNDKLEAPVGLITADEVAMAGAHYYNISKFNEKFYLYTGYFYETMTPFGYTLNLVDMDNNSYIYGLASDGYIEYNSTIGSLAVRPVISLETDALKYDALTSNGTKDYPFTVTGQQ